MTDFTTFRRDLEHTQNLAEAIHLFFGKDLQARLCLFDHESMEGSVAQAYNHLGRTSRTGTYKNIAEDFLFRTSYIEGMSAPNKILDIGCGSGILALEFVERTQALVFGLDSSADMISLANNNKRDRTEELVQKIIEDYRKGEPNFPRPIPAAYDIMPDIVDAANQIANRARFVHGSVYDLTQHTPNEKSIDYVVCRNALHRFRNPQEALRQMYAILKPGGKLYIRDLRRDADWKTVLDRIGEARWRTPVLVRDYLGAMAGMLTVEELATTLRELNINKFTLTDGSYKPDTSQDQASLREYAQATEYVGIIEK